MVATEAPALVPGTPIPATFPLARYRSPDLDGTVRGFIRSTTQPNDLVLFIGATSGKALVETVAESRKAVALGRNPLDLLCAALTLQPISGHLAEAALTKLGDQLKIGRPLILHTKSLYASRCPHCHAQGTAEWFAWNRDSGRPFAKRVICPHCGQARQGPVDAADLESAGRFPANSGPAYHLALSQVASHNEEQAHRVAELVQLYTPRNLSALMDIVRRLPRLHTGQEVRQVLDALVLEALDSSSALVPYETPDTRPRSLRAAQRFLERNVWMVLEQAVQSYQDHYNRGSRAHTAALPRFEALDALLTQPTPGYVLLNRSVKSLHDQGLAGRFHALVVHLSPPDATFWALAILWSTWLWGDEVPGDLHRFLQRRRLDWDWYSRGLAAALSCAQPLLAPKAPILILATEQEPEAAQAAVHAANSSGLGIDHWMVCHPTGYRAILRLREAGTADVFPAYGEAEPDATEVAAHLLEQRGEPTNQQTLQALSAFHTRSAKPFTPHTDFGSRLATLDPSHLWFRSTTETEDPLADLLESAACRLLFTGQRWEPDDLTAQLYAEFHGVLSPEPELVDAIIQAYARIGTDCRLSLRPEDDPQRRHEEQLQLRHDLLRLGERLGYSAREHPNNDIVWYEERSSPYLFRTTTSAILAPHLLATPPSCDGRRCLVIPGGRAALTVLKLRRDPRLAQLAAEHRWTFIKFRHLRRMMREITERTEIEVFLGLDPIVERESAQIPLPLQANARQ